MLSHKISKPTGTPVPDEKVKELSSNGARTDSAEIETDHTIWGYFGWY